MSYPRHLPLFDESVRQGAWSERMIAGEYAVHYSSFEETPGSALYCTVFGNLREAEAYAQQQVKARPSLRCTIYDHQGLIGPPLRDIRGSNFKDDSDLLPRVRRWIGSLLFFGGLILIIVDWSVDFRLDWPSIIGNRILIVGLILLFTEAMLALHAKHERSLIADKRRR
ncbi:MAG TPA: hypothetical protein VK798_14165 [Alloacidobacterium sp.]|jgi:hypothetical protein|nr:hypothetical protein [Alloacidobacterium sp.]